MNRGEAPGSRDGRSESAEGASVALPDLSKGGAGFDFSSILAVADMLPVMIAFIDAEQRLRFVNKPLAEWFERPRSSILGLTLRELIGEEAYARPRAVDREAAWRRAAVLRGGLSRTRRAGRWRSRRICALDGSVGRQVRGC